MIGAGGKYRIDGIVSLRPVATGVFTDKLTYSRGERVQLILVNASDQPIRPSSVVPFRVVKPDGTPVWDPIVILGGETVKPQVYGAGALIYPPQIPPGGELRGEWDQRDNKGRPVEAGSYKVRATIIEPQERTFESEEFRVV